MPRFLVEAYAPGSNRVELIDAVKRARRAAKEVARRGRPVLHLRSILVPGDETCFHLFESPSIEAVEDVCRRAQLTFHRVTEAVEEIPGKRGVR